MAATERRRLGAAALTIMLVTYSLAGASEDQEEGLRSAITSIRLSASNRATIGYRVSWGKDSTVLIAHGIDRVSFKFWDERQKEIAVQSHEGILIPDEFTRHDVQSFDMTFRISIPKNAKRIAIELRGVGITTQRVPLPSAEASRDK